MNPNYLLYSKKKLKSFPLSSAKVSKKSYLNSSKFVNFLYLFIILI